MCAAIICILVPLFMMSRCTIFVCFLLNKYVVKIRYHNKWHSSLILPWKSYSPIGEEPFIRKMKKDKNICRMFAVILFF